MTEIPTPTITSSSTSIRIAPGFRCPCGHVLRGSDIDVLGDRIRLDCSRCHRQLLEIEMHEYEV